MILSALTLPYVNPQKELQLPYTLQEPDSESLCLNSLPQGPFDYELSALRFEVKPFKIDAQTELSLPEFSRDEVALRL